MKLLKLLNHELTETQINELKKQLECNRNCNFK